MLPNWCLVCAIGVAASAGPQAMADDAERQEAARAALHLNRQGVDLQRAGELRAAADLFRRAIKLNQSAFPPSQYPHGHFALVACWKNLGFVLSGLEDYHDAAEAYDESLKIARRLHEQDQLAQGNGELAGILNRLGDLHCKTSSYRQAFEAYDESLMLNRKLYPKETHPDGHPSLAGALFWMGRVHREMGTPLRALAYYEEALAMLRRYYPKDRHPNGTADLAAALGRVADTLSLLGAKASAVRFQEESFQMSLRLLPEGSDPVSWRARSTTLGNTAESYRRVEDYGRSVPLFEQSLALHRKLYPLEQFPKGTFGTGLLLTNFASCLHDAGDGERGLALVREANAMFRALFPPERFPKGHVDIVITSALLANQLRDLGRNDEAREAYRTALARSRDYQNHFLGLASEADALQMAREFVYEPRDGFLSVTPPSPEADAEAYRHVWFTKSLMTRILERRHIVARLAAADPKAKSNVAAKWRELSGVRRQLDQALQSSPENPGRTKRLDELTKQKEQLERDLTAAVPELQRERLRDRQSPEELASHLPPHRVFVDYLLWTHFSQDPRQPGKKGRRTSQRYSAFVVAPGKPPLRIDLGDAAPIDVAVTAWQEQIALGAPAETAAATAAHVRRLVWAPVVKHLPLGTQALYLGLDDALHRLPFAALPGSKPQQVLLEEVALAQVPHGPFLLEQLQHPKFASKGPARILTLGGVDYGAAADNKTPHWPFLPGTAAESAQVQRFAFEAARVIPLSGTAADADALLRELPTARYAHLATHGFFRDDELEEEEKQLWAFYQKQGKYDFGKDSVAVRAGAARRTPLALVGLVLAGANRAPLARDAKSAPIVTGETIVTLPLEKLRLCVLSACETGLGNYAGGEGVQGLQRAFHLAGCPNVVASLWKVNDAATAALMAKFYHEMWVNKKPPIEALREAQLTIYRHPELIPDLAGERGAPRLKDAVAVGAGAPATGAGKRADTKLWAAFVLSGEGR